MKSPISKRSVIIAGHKTSVSLEYEFWNSLKDWGRWSPRSIAIANMPIYRQLFDFLCLASIAISVPKTEPAQPQPGERVDAPILPVHSGHRHRVTQGCRWLSEQRRRGANGAASALTHRGMSRGCPWGQALE